MKITTKILAITVISLALSCELFAIVTPTANPAHASEAALQHASRNVFGARQGFPFWKNMGVVNDSSATYVGNGWVLTAAHVGPGVFQMHDGSRYQPIPGSEQFFRNNDGTLTDLCAFRIAFHRGDSAAMLPSVPLGEVRPGRGSWILLLGAGSGNSHARPVSDNGGFRWNADYRMRWGINRVEYGFSAPMRTENFMTLGYSTRFQAGELECQATPGDSGGAVFAYNTVSQRWELCGVILAVDSEHGKASYGNQTYIADLTIMPAGFFESDPRRMFAAH